MGRYYNGDIDGKFWVAVQASNAADQFGFEGVEPSQLEYGFESEHIPFVKEGIKKIKDRLDYKKVHGFFDKVDWYSQDELEEAKITREEVRDYADLVLGEKILKCIEEDGACYFTAEC